MNEKTYKSMQRAGICNIVIGIVVVAVGITAGVLMLISGGKLLKEKSKIIF